MIRAVIADDEPLARDVIRGLLSGYADVSVVAESRNGIETLGAIRERAPDLLFLDVQMPDLDGFGVLAAIEPASCPALVFVTAFDEHAVRAFEAAALDYLVKPFSDERFHRTMSRVRRQLGGPESVALAQAVAALLARANSRSQERSGARRRLLVTSGRRAVSVRVADVQWIEADDYYTRIHVDGGSHLLRYPLAALERDLDPDEFVRVHRGAIVNMEMVRELARTPRGHLEVVMIGGQRLTVSERRRDAVLARFGAIEAP